MPVLPFSFTAEGVNSAWSSAFDAARPKRDKERARIAAVPERVSAVPDTCPEKVSITPSIDPAGKSLFAFPVPKDSPEKEALRKGACPGVKRRESVPLTGEEKTDPSACDAVSLFSAKRHHALALSTGIPLTEAFSRERSPERTGEFHFPSPTKLMESFPARTPAGTGGQREDISARSRPLTRPATDSEGRMVPRASISPLPALRERDLTAIPPPERSIPAVPIIGTEFTCMSMSAETVFSENERPMREIAALLCPNLILLPEISARCMETAWSPDRGVRRESRSASLSPSMSALMMEKELTAGFMERRDFGLIFRRSESALRKGPCSVERVNLPVEKPCTGFPEIPSTVSSAPRNSFAAFLASLRSKSPAKSAPAAVKNRQTSKKPTAAVIRKR